MDHHPDCYRRNVMGPCICRQLRACEQRKDREWMERMTRQEQYIAGVQAAREAIAACQQYTDDPFVYIDRLKALVAIDGLLKGEQA